LAAESVPRRPARVTRWCRCRTVAASAALVVASVAGGAALAPLARASTTAARSAADASFVGYGGRVWHVVGGAALYVPSWTPFGGRQRTTPLTAGQFAALRPWPADGTFVHDVQDGRVYRFAGGAPVYVSTWAAFGGVQPSIAIDATDVANAGLPSPWQAVKALPMDRSEPVFLRSAQDGRVYRSVGGAPVYVSTWAIYGGVQPSVTVDKAAIGHAGEPGVWRFLLNHPPDGTYLQGLRAGTPVVTKLFVVAGGAPIFVPVPTDVPPPTVLWPVDQVAIDAAGSGGGYNHLRKQPQPGTYLAGSPALPGTDLYSVVAGAPIELPTAGACGAHIAAVLVDSQAILHAGTGGDFDHLAAPPDPSPLPC
jgi:hypothetical protein